MILYTYQAEPAFGLCAPATLPFVGVQVMGGVASFLLNIGKQTIAWTAYEDTRPVTISEAA
jgi:hypothetical protein